MGKIISLLIKKEFDLLIKNNNFFEYAKIFDNYYGTLKETVLKFLSLGKDVLFDIDWQGTQQLQKIKDLSIVAIFVSFLQIFKGAKREIIKSTQRTRKIN